MLDVLMEYGLFLAQAVTIVIAVGAIAVIVTVAARKGHSTDDTIEVTRLNDRFDELSLPLKMAALPGKAFKSAMKADKKARKALPKLVDKLCETCVKRDSLKDVVNSVETNQHHLHKVVVLYMIISIF